MNSNAVVQTRSAVNPVPAHVPGESSLEASIASSIVDVRDAQRLRYQVFASEMGAQLDTPEPGLDIDAFDPYCRHLLVRDRSSGEVVATTRVLSNRDAELAGGFYSEQEFDLDRFLASAGPVLEIGRTCVHPSWRSGAAISMLWSGLARFIDLQQYEYLIGCASLPASDGGISARAVYDKLKDKYLLADTQRVTPLCPVPNADATHSVEPVLPPLLKAYLRLGARIGGEPCLDPLFSCADLLIVLSPLRVARKYARHFIERG